VEDIAYRVIAAQAKPDHATIARFVERHQGALAGVFGAVLGLCARAGLVGLNVVAVDGSKVAANASREVNVDYERLAREVIQDARQVDAEEDERFGDRRGDELPPEVSTRNGRQQWFKEAKRRLDDQRAAEGAPMPRDRAKRVREAKRRLDEQLFTEARANEAFLRSRASGKDHRGWRLSPGTTPKPYTPPEIPPGVINTTDLDSRMVKGQHGFLQGYNAQAAVDGAAQIIVAHALTPSMSDQDQLVPLIDAAKNHLGGRPKESLRRCRILQRAQPRCLGRARYQGLPCDRARQAPCRG
jgi:hypothetical protein